MYLAIKWNRLADYGSCIAVDPAKHHPAGKDADIMAKLKRPVIVRAFIQPGKRSWRTLPCNDVEPPFRLHNSVAKGVGIEMLPEQRGNNVIPTISLAEMAGLAAGSLALLASSW